MKRCSIESFFWVILFFIIFTAIAVIGISNNNRIKEITFIKKKALVENRFILPGSQMKMVGVVFKTNTGEVNYGSMGDNHYEEGDSIDIIYNKANPNEFYESGYKGESIGGICVIISIGLLLYIIYWIYNYRTNK